MNKKLLSEIDKSLNADVKQSKKENFNNKKIIENITNESTILSNSFVDINDPTTYKNYNLLTPDKAYQKNQLLNTLLSSRKQADASIQFQFNRERIRDFASKYGGKMVKINNNGSSDGNIYYITNFGDAIKKNGGMNNMSKTCNSKPININFEHVENYNYNKFTGNYLISTIDGRASTKTNATIIKVLDHTMSEFHPCGMEDTFVYVGLNKDNYRHGVKVTNPDTKNSYISCYHDDTRLGPRTIIENKTVEECGKIASEKNSNYASASVGKFSESEMLGKGINDYSYNKNGIKYYGIKNAKKQSDGKTRGQCILLSADLQDDYVFNKWRSEPDYLGCWGDWYDNPWGLRKRTRAMSRIYSSSMLTFESCKTNCTKRGYSVWALQYASGNPARGQCFCSHINKSREWQKYGGANNCKRDNTSGYQVGGSWSNAIYKHSVNPRPQDKCFKSGGNGNIIAFYEAERFQEDNLGKNAYIDQEGISHELSATDSKRIFYMNDAKDKNTIEKTCNISNIKHNEITSKEWNNLRIDYDNPYTCNEKQTDHDFSNLVNANNTLNNVVSNANNLNDKLNEKLILGEKNIMNKSQQIGKNSSDAKTILTAISNPPVISAFTNDKNNLSIITNMASKLMKKIKGDTSNIIEGHQDEDKCHGSDGNGVCGIPVYGLGPNSDDYMLRGHKTEDHENGLYERAEQLHTEKILNTIKNYFNSSQTFDAQQEFTLLDVTSKKQWMYLWGVMIISILSYKFYIMSKK